MTDETTDTEPTDTQTPDQAMEATIRETYRSLSNPEDSPNPEGSLVVASGQPTAASQPEATPSGDRTRGRNGRFVASTTAQPQPAAPEAAAPEAKPYDTYPASWKKDHEGKWATVDPAIREEVHRREQNFLDGLKEYKQPAAFGRALGEHLLPHVDTFRRLGTTPVDVLRDVMSHWSKLVNGDAGTKQQVLLQIARDFGIEWPSRTAQPPPAGAAQPASTVDFSPVLQRVEGIEKALQAQRDEAARLQAAEDDATLKAFAADPKHEHFAAVQVTMGQLLSAGTASTLDDAYDKATWLVPEVRAKIQAKADADRRSQEAEQAAAARKAAAANVRPRGTPPVARKPGSMEDTIREKGRELGMF